MEGDRRQGPPFELLVIDAAKGQYAIDERNSIVLGSTYIAGALYSQFGVMAARLPVYSERWMSRSPAKLSLVIRDLNRGSVSPKVALT